MTNNLAQTRKAIAEIVQSINQHKAARTSTNEEIAALRAKAETLGISKKALDAAMQYMNMDPEQRESFDLAYSIVREAIGLEIRRDEDLESWLSKQQEQAQEDAKPKKRGRPPKSEKAEKPKTPGTDWPDDKDVAEQAEAPDDEEDGEDGEDEDAEGEQVLQDGLPATNAAQEAAQGDDDRLQAIHDEGREARFEGHGPQHNPYDEGTVEHSTWRGGWDEARDEGQNEETNTGRLN